MPPQHTNTRQASKAINTLRLFGFAIALALNYPKNLGTA
jgi:hypothetical protein